jgi:lectin, mannose-binding 2
VGRGRQPFDAEHWSVEFEFRVDGQGSKVYGDGFAFWVTEERAQPGILAARE